MQYPKDTLQITYPINAHMHYPCQGNANALNHFIVLQYPSRPNCNYFISFFFICAIPYGHIDNIISNLMHTSITLIKVMQMHYIILLLCNTHAQNNLFHLIWFKKNNYWIILVLCNTLMLRLYFISSNWRMQYLMDTLTTSCPTIFTSTLPLLK
jgi:hypothetical protein